MTKKKHPSSKKRSITQWIATALLVLLSIIATYVFYLLLIIGVACIIGGFATLKDGTSLGFFMTGGIIIAATLILNLIITRIATKKWTITWPNIGDLWPLGA